MLQQSGITAFQALPDEIKVTFSIAMMSLIIRPSFIAFDVFKLTKE